VIEIDKNRKRKIVRRCGEFIMVDLGIWSISKGIV